MSSDILHSLARRIAEQTMKYPYKVWGFGEGFALEALWQAADALDEPAYRDFVLRGIFERWLARTPALVEADHSAAGGLLVEVYEQSGDERYLALALRLAEHMHALPSDATGARFHRPTHPDYHDYLYVDCMEVDAPFLCQLARTTGDEAFFDRAAEQILGYSALLQDEESGLFYHQYNGTTRQVNGSFWGRGNGWALLGFLKTLTLLPPEHARYAEIHERFRRLAGAVAACQLPSGDWVTVLDRPETTREASLPAMFGYAIENAVTRKLLPDSLKPVAERAWDAMQRRLSPEGLLEGVSVATPPGNTAHYNTIATGAGFPWGQGPALLWVLERLA